VVTAGATPRERFAVSNEVIAGGVAYTCSETGLWQPLVAALICSPVDCGSTILSLNPATTSAQCSTGRGANATRFGGPLCPAWCVRGFEPMDKAGLGMTEEPLPVFYRCSADGTWKKYPPDVAPLECVPKACVLPDAPGEGVIATDDTMGCEFGTMLPSSTSCSVACDTPEWTPIETGLSRFFSCDHGILTSAQLTCVRSPGGCSLPPRLGSGPEPRGLEAATLGGCIPGGTLSFDTSCSIRCAAGFSPINPHFIDAIHTSGDAESNEYLCRRPLALVEFPAAVAGSDLLGRGSIEDSVRFPAGTIVSQRGRGENVITKPRGWGVITDLGSLAPGTIAIVVHGGRFEATPMLDVTPLIPREWNETADFPSCSDANRTKAEACSGYWDDDDDGGQLVLHAGRTWRAASCSDASVTIENSCVGTWDHDGDGFTAELARVWTPGHCEGGGGMC
jgi:hypothetical protein